MSTCGNGNRWCGCGYCESARSFATQTQAQAQQDQGLASMAKHQNVADLGSQQWALMRGQSPLSAAIEGQDALRARVAELETAALANKAQLSTMLTRNVRQENELAVLRARESEVPRLRDECGSLRSDNDRLTLENARLRRKLGQ